LQPWCNRSFRTPGSGRTTDLRGDETTLTTHRARTAIRRTNPATHWRSRLTKAGLGAGALVAVAALGLLASGCGGRSGEGVAQVDSTDTTTTRSDSQSGSSERSPTAYAACMRRNGVPNFPDPNANGQFRFDKNQISGWPRYRAAESACQRLRPSGPTPTRQQQAEALRLGMRYAACMRAHGVPTFPDPVPNAQGGGIDFDLHAGHLSSESPKFKAADTACIELGRGMKNALGPRGSSGGSTP
jgi:hypothetical protein